MTGYIYKGKTYTDLNDIADLIPNASIIGNPTLTDLESFGVTEDKKLLCYCVVGTSTPTYVSSTDTYKLKANEVLMTADRTVSNTVAKEDGTWVTPPSEYTVYTCTDGKLAVDVNSTYAAINSDYESQYNTLARGSYASLAALKNGLITQAQYDTNITNLATQHATLINKIKAEQEAAING